MARMYPEAGPHVNSESEAEHRLYRLFQRELDDSWTIYHSVHFQTPQSRSLKDNSRECDFLLIVPAHGILVLEVKGGQVRKATQHTKRWYADMQAKTDHRTNPFEQAKSLLPMLRRTLYDGPLTAPYAPSIPIYHAVWFPDIEWDHKLASPMMNSVVLHRADYASPEEGLLRVIRNQAHSVIPAPMSPECVAALTETLGTSIQLTSRFSISVLGVEERIAELTKQQFRLLDRLDEGHRLCVSGPAGTGKTVLAFEKARRMATQGMRVLILCENPALARHLNLQLKPEHPLIKQQISIQDVYELIRDLRSATGKSQAQPMPTTSDRAAELMAVALREARKRPRAEKPDAIIVDDAQDLDPAMWKLLPQLLRDERHGAIYAFCDPAQHDGNGRWRLPMPLAREGTLTDNLRNTREVHTIVQAFHQRAGARADQLAACTVEGGRPAWFLDPSLVVRGHDEDPERAALRVALERLIETDGLDPNDILIITCRSQEKSQFFGQGVQRVGSYRVVHNDDGARRTAVGLSTIRAARGLERRIVILVELDGIADTRLRDRYLYQATSRAVHHLVVLSPSAAFYAKPRSGQSLFRTASAAISK